MSLLLAFNDASQTFVLMRRRSKSFQTQPVPRDLGRVLFAGFEADGTAKLRRVGRSSRGPEALAGGDVVGEVEKALAERKPHQVVVIEADRAAAAAVAQAARILCGLPQGPYVVLAGSPSTAAQLRRLTGAPLARLFIVAGGLGPITFELVRALAERWSTDQALAGLWQAAEAVQHDNRLVEVRVPGVMPAAAGRRAGTALFETALDSLRLGVLVLDRDLRIVLNNERVAALTGLPAQAVCTGASAYSLIALAVSLGHYPQRSLEEVYGAFCARLARREAFDQEYNLADGRVIAVSIVPVADEGWVLAYDDITDRIRAEEAMEEQSQRFDVALRNMPHGLCMFDGDNRVVFCNAAYVRMYALPPELTAAGTPLQAILDFRAGAGNDPDDLSAYVDMIGVAQAKGARINARVQLRDGRTVQIAHNPMVGGGYIATHEDISETVRADARIAHMAHHDALTGLANRVLLRERAEEAFARVRRGAKPTILSLDIDHFKAVNDTLGHPIGDLLLKAVAARLLDCVRKSDTLARVGGDEFVIVQNHIESPQQADALARRLLEALREPFELDGHQVVVSACIGVAFGPDDGQDADRLLKNAGTALSRAKAEGAGLYRFFEPAMDAKLQERRLLELDLRRAFASGEFELFYQPVVDAMSEAIVAFEALLRWHHPKRGMVSPAEFIPVAEATGLIVPLGEWVIRQACADAAKWPSHVKVAVNLSPVQFVSPALVHTVVSALGESGLSARRLEIEITETALLADNQATLAALHHLRSLGVWIAMDDFGTGYSSLSYLRSFPFDKIKIDRSFVSDLGQRGDCLAIIKAVSGLGANLGMTTTVEGVETIEQLRLVREYGCTQIQGYYFSPPRPVGEVMKMLRAKVPAVA